ncbi:TonB-dependent receptor [Porticoccus sp. W117]|uniref:TonB-dependent receptor n=1 Tax=Porticoccus sp. W117 TaxID=3054777 RepID=UPI0025982D67|nr:TonB-dependent receptor [Porticoccus sp. W117]MDM3872095.1 TonB-dependent receptor [Porticoccus sp. W117]
MVKPSGFCRGFSGKSLAACVAAIVASQVAVAEEQQTRSGVLEEIVSTAQKRPESLQSVPISVNTVSGAKLADTGITNLEKLTAYVPNFSMNQTGIGSTITIRGISSGINQGFEQSVGQYVDGVYYGRAAVSRAPFLDLERIEVLRGPQGTLFGKNSIGGAISIQSARPTEEFEGSVSALYEPSDGEQELRFVASGAFSDNVRARVALMDRSIDGFVRNTTLNRDEKGENEQVFRLGVEWDINDDLSLYFKAERTEFDVDGRNIELFDPVTLPVPGAITHVQAVNGLQALLGRPLVDSTLDRVRDSNGDNSSDTVDSYVVELDYQAGDHELTFVTGWFEYDHSELCDCDFTGASLFQAFGDESFEQFSQEIRLTSPASDTFEYITGIYYQSSELDFNDRLFIPQDSLLNVALPAANAALAPIIGFLPNSSSQRSFQQDTDVWAVFAQGTWQLAEDWSLTAGGRYTSEDKDATRRQFNVNQAGVDVGNADPILNTFYGIVGIEAYDPLSGSRSENSFTPLVTLEWQASDDALLYASWTRGFKSGGFDVRSNAHPDAAVGVTVLSALGPVFNPGPQGSFEFEEEEATNFELGTKLTLLNGAAELNGAIFFTDYEDLQVSQFDGTLGFNVTNAAEASIKGLELEGRLQATDGLVLSSSLSYLDFEYDSFNDSQCFFGQAVTDPGSVTDPVRGLCNVAGSTREYTPEWRATFVADHTATVMDNYQLRTTVDVLYVDDYLWNPTLDPRNVQDAYTEVNARIGFGPSDGKWEVSLLGRNLTDEEVINFGGDAPLASLLTQRSGNAYYGFINRDRSVAIQATVKF